MKRSHHRYPFFIRVAASSFFLVVSVLTADLIDGATHEGWHDRPVVSDKSVDARLTELVDQLKQDYAETMNLSEANQAAIKEVVEKQFDSFVDAFEENRSSDQESDRRKRLELLAESRNAFVDLRVGLIAKEVTGQTIPDMEYHALESICTNLQIHVGLEANLVDGAPVAGSRIVVLNLPKMDCPGCAQIVRDKLAEIEGVLESATSVEKAHCRVRVSADVELENELNELAKSVTQFEDWTKE